MDQVVCVVCLEFGKMRWTNARRRWIIKRAKSDPWRARCRFVPIWTKKWQL
jgi:hypothetical protein